MHSKSNAAGFAIKCHRRTGSYVWPRWNLGLFALPYNLTPYVRCVLLDRWNNPSIPILESTAKISQTILFEIVSSSSRKTLNPERQKFPLLPIGRDMGSCTDPVPGHLGKLSAYRKLRSAASLTFTPFHVNTRRTFDIRPSTDSVNNRKLYIAGMLG